MSKKLSASDTGYPFFKVYYAYRHFYRVTEVILENNGKLVFNVAFSSLNKLHRLTNENCFSAKINDELKTTEIFDKLRTTGTLCLNEYL